MTYFFDIVSLFYFKSVTYKAILVFIDSCVLGHSCKLDQTYKCSLVQVHAITLTELTIQTLN